MFRSIIINHTHYKHSINNSHKWIKAKFKKWTLFLLQSSNFSDLDRNTQIRQHVVMIGLLHDIYKYFKEIGSKKSLTPSKVRILLMTNSTILYYC